MILCEAGKPLHPLHLQCLIFPKLPQCRKSYGPLMDVVLAQVIIRPKRHLSVATSQRVTSQQQFSVEGDNLFPKTPGHIKLAVQDSPLPKSFIHEISSEPSVFVSLSLFIFSLLLLLTMWPRPYYCDIPLSSLQCLVLLWMPVIFNCDPEKMSL